MTILKFEVPQDDGITVKERIIRFLERKMSRENAEQAYDCCVYVAEKFGDGAAWAFDTAIEGFCEVYELDAKELASEIRKHNNSKSN